MSYLDSVEVFGVGKNVKQFTVTDEVQTRKEKSLGFQIILRIMHKDLIELLFEHKYLQTFENLLQ